MEKHIALAKKAKPDKRQEQGDGIDTQLALHVARRPYAVEVDPGPVAFAVQQVETLVIKSGLVELKQPELPTCRELFAK
jgi:hypothetical protein